MALNLGNALFDFLTAPPEGTLSSRQILERLV